MPRAAPKLPPGATGGSQKSSIFSSWKFKLAIAVGACSAIWGYLTYEAAVAQELLTPVVTPLNDSDFEAFVQAHPEGALIDFYTPDCPFCKKIAPQFEKAANQMKGKVNSFAWVNSTTAPLTIKKYGLHRYPTVNWFWKGDSVNELPRAAEKTAEQIVAFVQKSLEPAFEEIPTRTEIEEALPMLRNSLHDQGSPLFVAFGGSKELRAALDFAAQRFRGKTAFLFVTEPDGIDGPAMKAFGKTPEADHEFTGAVNGEAIREWVSSIVDAKTIEKLEAKMAKMKENKEGLEDKLKEAEANATMKAEEREATKQDMEKELEEKLQQAAAA